MSNIIIKQLELGPMANYVYLLGDPVSKSCAVIDPGWEISEILRRAEKEGVTMTHILLTHTHFDHAAASERLAKKTGAKIYVHYLEADKIEIENKVEIEEGDKIKVGGLEVTCLHTPGHTTGSSCFLVDRVVFTGDTLFVDGIGRTDLEDGDPQEMFKSLARLKGLPDGMVVYPGHNYGSESASTVGEQKKRNRYMKCKSVSEFMSL